MYIYLDILILTNFIINLFLLLLTAFISQKKIMPIRIIMSSTLGSCSVLLMFFNINIFLFSLIKLLIAVAMLSISFREKPKAYIKLLTLFYVLSFTMSGIVYYLNMTYNQRDIVTEITIILSGISITIMMFISIKFVRERIKNKENYYNVCISHNGKSISVIGFFDTGNNLKEPLSGLPVLILSEKETKKLGEIKTFPIICKTISGKGIINAFVPDKITVNNEVINCYIGLSSALKNENFSILLNNNLRRTYNVS